MPNFTVTQPLPDVFHIQDIGKVCFTLIRGQRDTLLWDTGMGFYDVAECIAPYVLGKLTVVLSHAHYDHACGQHYFGEAFVHPDDLQWCRKCAGKAHRKLILRRVRSRGILPDDYSAEIFLNGTPKTIKPLQKMTLDLGNLEVQFLHTPGHTPGSIVAYIPKRGLLLTADTWNPTTWLFFADSSSLADYAKTIQSLRDLPVVHVLCAHDLNLSAMARLRAYIDGLNEQTFADAQPCSIPPHTETHTFCCHPEPASTLVFNGDNRG